LNKRFGFEIHRHKKSIGIVTTIKGNYGEKKWHKFKSYKI